MEAGNKSEFSAGASALPARHEGSGTAVDGEPSQMPIDDENSNNNKPDCGAAPCMPLNESFHDVCPPITECFRCDVEEYEHEHEIGPYKDHHYSHQESATEAYRKEFGDCGVLSNIAVKDLCRRLDCRNVPQFRQDPSFQIFLFCFVFLFFPYFTLYIMFFQDI